MDCGSHLFGLLVVAIVRINMYVHGCVRTCATYVHGGVRTYVQGSVRTYAPRLELYRYMAHMVRT